MAMRKTRLDRRNNTLRTGGLAIAVLLFGLGGCNPIETYRNWTGISENDPNPQTTPNTKNLAAGEAKSYPNLATVPPPPSQALTMAQLNTLTQSLIADRTHAKYSSEQLQATFDEAAAPPPPPPTTAGGTTKTAPAAAASGPGPASAAPAAASPAPAHAATPTSGSGGRSPASPVAAGAAAGPRKPGQPPEPGPMESSLQSPQIAPLPQPEGNQPAPPPPSELALPAASTPAKPSAAATAPPASAHLPPPPAAAPMPAAIGSAQFQPPPPVPVLPPPEPLRTAAATPGKPARPPAPSLSYAKVAAVGFATGSTALSDADRQILGEVASRYREAPGPVRVVGYATVGTGSAQQLGGYRTALDRAHAVAGALAKAGIPANKIAVEAAPAGAGAQQDKAEILFAR